MINFLEHTETGYKGRTFINANADATIAIAVDFTSAGERLTKKSVLDNKKLYVDIDVSNRISLSQSLIELTIRSFNKHKVHSLNIAGNGIYTMLEKYTQQQCDLFTFALLHAIVNHPNLENPILSIRTGGQTGFDESGAKAGHLLDIPTTILAPKGWKFRDISGKDISNESKFKARFDKTLNWKGDLDKLLEASKNKFYEKI